MSDWRDDFLVDDAEQARLQAAYRLLLGRDGRGSLAESSPSVSPEEQPALSPPEWGAADLTLRAAA